MGFSIVQPNLLAIAIALTGLDFFSNLPVDQIEEDLEDGQQPLNATLLTQSENFSDKIFISNAAIRHGGVRENNIFSTKTSNSPFQIGISQVSTVHSSSPQISSSQVSINQVSTQVGSPQNSFSEIGFSQERSQKLSFSQVSTAEFGASQVDKLQNTPSQPRSAQVDSAQFIQSSFIFTQPSNIQVLPTEVKSPEVSFSSSVASVEFLGSQFFHHSNSQSLNNINNSATQIWSNHLTPHPIDITFLFTDLPTGQLAEAVITSFDPNGRPNGGTLLLDHNANGRGWYIDPPPFDHSASRLGLSVAKPNIFNPVKQGLVKAVKDWEYSSFHRCVAQRVYPMN